MAAGHLKISSLVAGSIRFEFHSRFAVRVIDRSEGGRFNGEAKVAQTRENRILASEHAV